MKESTPITDRNLFRDQVIRGKNIETKGGGKLSLSFKDSITRPNIIKLDNHFLKY